MPNKVFISYSSIKDLNGTVSEFHKYLQNEIQLNTSSSVTVFLDKEGIKDGNNWQGTLSKALDECTVFVLLLSPSWLHSDWCRKEYLYFKSLPPTHIQRVIIPLRWVNTIAADAQNNTEEDIINQINEIQQVNWLQLRYDSDYQKSESLRRAVGELAVSIADCIKGFTLIIKYPFGFEEKVKPNESRPGILAKRMQQAATLTTFIPTWLIAENEFDPIGNKPSDDDLIKIRSALPSFISWSIYDHFSSEYFRTNYDQLPEIEAMVADFRSAIQLFDKELGEIIGKSDEAVKALWRFLLKEQLLQLRIDAVKIKEKAQEIFDKSGASLN